MSDPTTSPESNEFESELHQIGKRTPFETPADYFESFPVRVQEGYQTPARRSMFWWLWVPVGTTAALVALVVSVWLQPSSGEMSPLTATDIQIFLEEEADGDLDWMMAEVLTDDELSNLTHLSIPTESDEELEALFLEDQIGLADVAESALEL